MVITEYETKKVKPTISILLKIHNHIYCHVFMKLQSHSQIISDNQSCFNFRCVRAMVLLPVLVHVICGSIRTQSH